MLRVLYVANGHGETAIAARIASEVGRLARGPVAQDLLPLVGTGAGAEPLAVVGPRRTMPSGGLVAMGNIRAFSRDLLAGFTRLLTAQIGFLAVAARCYDLVVAVGDAYALGMALTARLPAIFVGTAKSVYVAPYGPFERTLLQRAERAFVRDVPTAELLRAQGVEAEAPGNVIVDLAFEAVEPVPAGEWLGILPGSREEAYADAIRLARVVRALGTLRPGPGALLSVAPTIDAARLIRALVADGWVLDDTAGLPGAAFSARADTARLIGWPGSLGTLLRASVLVIGQAGTANEQAAALGIPVVALAEDSQAQRTPSRSRGEPGESPAGGSGGIAPRSNWYRMRQGRLLGEGLRLVPAAPHKAAAAVAELLADADELARMGAAGQARMGPAGGAAVVAQAILAAASPAATRAG